LRVVWDTGGVPSIQPNFTDAVTGVGRNIYDFTPLTGHTFGTSVPCGFGQRLRVHQTRVV
jgi:hypothetical protein